MSQFNTFICCVVSALDTSRCVVHGAGLQLGTDFVTLSNCPSIILTIVYNEHFQDGRIAWIDSKLLLTIQMVDAFMFAKINSFSGTRVNSGGENFLVTITYSAESLDRSTEEKSDLMSPHQMREVASRNAQTFLASLPLCMLLYVLCSPIHIF